MEDFISTRIAQWSVIPKQIHLQHKLIIKSLNLSYYNPALSKSAPSVKLYISEAVCNTAAL